jgi:sugar phosphate isomerase/epimerase
MVRDVVDTGRDPKALRRRLDDRGLRAGAFPLPIDWRRTTDHEFDLALARLSRYAEAAAILGLTRTGTWVEPEIPALPGLDEGRAFEFAFDRHLRRLGALAAVLARQGVRLGLEVIGVVSSRPGRGPAFIAGLGSPRLEDLLTRLRERYPDVGILLDVWHLYAAGEDVGAALRWGTDRIVWVQLADLPAGSDPDRLRMIDQRRGWPGDHGAVDCQGVLRRLAETGYAGPVTAEPLGQEMALGPRAAAERAFQALRAVWPGTLSMDGHVA